MANQLTPRIQAIGAIKRSFELGRGGTPGVRLGLRGFKTQTGHVLLERLEAPARVKWIGL